MVKLLRRIINLFKKCKMANINNLTSYPTATPVANSIVIGSIASGDATNNFLMSDILTYIMSSSTLTLQDVCDNGTATTTGITVGGTTTLNGAVDINNTADISGNTTIGGTLGVTGGATFTGAIDANSTADIADTLTLSRATGTGLQVDANATIDGILYLTRTGGAGLSVTSDVNIGGGIECYGLHHQWGALTVEGITTLNNAVDANSNLSVAGAIDANSTADIADTLTLSKATGTGLAVTADATIGGTLTMGIGDGVVTNQITAPTGANIAFYMGGVQRGAFVAPLGGLSLGYGLTVTSGSTILQDTLVQGGLYTTPDTPASASASGIAGQISVDANYIYVCTATNTWKRVAIATW
jgi:hypothetical protein